MTMDLPDQEEARLRSIGSAEMPQHLFLETLLRNLRYRTVTYLLSPEGPESARLREDLEIHDMLDDESSFLKEKVLLAKRQAATPRELEEAEERDWEAAAFCAKGQGRRVAPDEMFPVPGLSRHGDAPCVDAGDLEFGAELGGDQMKKVAAIEKDFAAGEQAAKSRLQALNTEAVVAAHRSGNQVAAIGDVFDKIRDALHATNALEAEKMLSVRGVLKPEQVASARSAHEAALGRCLAERHGLR